MVRSLAIASPIVDGALARRHARTDGRPRRRRPRSGHQRSTSMTWPSGSLMRWLTAGDGSPRVSMASRTIRSSSERAELRHAGRDASTRAHRPRAGSARVVQTCCGAGQRGSSVQHWSRRSCSIDALGRDRRRAGRRSRTQSVAGSCSGCPSRRRGVMSTASILRERCTMTPGHVGRRAMRYQRVHTGARPCRACWKWRPAVVEPDRDSIGRAAQTAAMRCSGRSSHGSAR